MKVEARQIIRAGRSEVAGRTGSSATRNVVIRSTSALEALKSRLLGAQLANVESGELRQRLHRAADDSASLAWATSIPLLALPELLAEKAREAFRQFERQKAIKTHGRSHNAQFELAA